MSSDQFPDRTEREREHRCQTKGIDLREGDRVLFNDRSVPLVVVGRHNRQNSSRNWMRRGVAKYHTVIELEGNGTDYHLLCTGGSEHGPMLYKRADWDEDKTNSLGISPVYSRMGERVEKMSVIDDE